MLKYFLIKYRRRNCILQIWLCHGIQCTIVVLDNWTAVRCRMVVQEAARFFSSSRMVWSAWMVAGAAIRTCRSVFFVIVASETTYVSCT